MRLQHNMALEFITLLMRMSNNNYFFDYATDKKFSSDGELNDQILTFIDSLDYFERTDLETVFSKFKLNFYFLILYIEKNKIDTVETLLAKLESEKAHVYASNCFRLSSFDIKMDDSAAVFGEKLSGKFDQETIELYLVFKEKPKALLDRLVAIIQVCFHKFFKAYQNEINDKMITITEDHNEIFQENPNKFMKVIGNGDYSNLLKLEEKGLYICYFEEFIPRYIHDAETHIFCYGYSEIQKYKLNSEESGVPIELFKMLADDTRLGILKILAIKKWSRKDLVKEIGLTSATMTYQLNKLLELDLIEMVAGENRKQSLYYVDQEKTLSIINKSVASIFK